MEKNASVGLKGQREERERRRRIARIKSTMIGFLIVGVLASVGLCLFLTWKVAALEQKIDQITDAIQISEELHLDGKGGSGQGTVYAAGEESSVEDTIDSQSDGLIGNYDANNQPVEGEPLKVYLTFDDGPSENTGAILDVLNEYNVKATFFVIGKEDDTSKEMYQRIVAEGHTLGMHSYSHKYSKIYESTNAFQRDLKKLQSLLLDVTGVECKLTRFPGGSSNQVSNTDMTEFISYLKEEGITYYDWNVSCGDATSQNFSAEELVDNVVSDVVKYDTSVVLLHDASTKDTTVESLGPMIESLQAMGAQILPIDENTRLIQHISADSVD